MVFTLVFTPALARQANRKGGVEYAVDLLPKLKPEIACHDEQVEPLIGAIQESPPGPGASATERSSSSRSAR